MGILLGLLTAVAWGGSDFCARFAARRVGALRTTLYMQLMGLLLLTIFLPYIGGWGHLTDGSGWRPWAWGALAGVVSGVSNLALYRSFEIGKMAVVATLSASYPALTVLLSLLTGEHLTGIRAAGIALILAGALLVVRGETPPEESTGKNASPSPPTVAPTSKTGRGIGWAILSGCGFGVLFWLLGTWIVPKVGTAATVWMIRLTSSLLTTIVILLLRQPIGPPREGSVNSWLLGMGLLDSGAFVLNNRGMLIEQVSVMGVLASLYGAFTVTLAAIFLRERLSRWQWAGIVLIFGGIYLISR
jgi:drug/metabolite transporter (DMT)-like permease